MEIYHYASANKGSFTELRALRKQQELENKIINTPYPSYVDHVSFYMSVVPLSAITRLYERKGVEHPFWFDGHRLIEYTVELDDQKFIDFNYRLAESREVINLYYDSSVSEREYIQSKEKIEKEYGYIGDDVNELNELIKKQLRTLPSNYFEICYKELMGRSNFEDNRNKYAPCVPHLMIYCRNGTFKIKRKREIKINTESSKPYINWV